MTNCLGTGTVQQLFLLEPRVIPQLKLTSQTQTMTGDVEGGSRQMTKHNFTHK